jgi:hypothetical protein
MSSITLTLPDDLAARLRVREKHVAEILELGLRELDAEEQGGYDGAAKVLDFFVGLPSPEEVLELRPSDRFQARIRGLLEKSRTTGLSPAEQEEWERYEFLEHLVAMAKANAVSKLRQPPVNA